MVARALRAAEPVSPGTAAISVSIEAEGAVVDAAVEASVGAAATGATTGPVAWALACAAKSHSHAYVWRAAIIT